MGKKIALNIFYTIGLILCLLGIIWSFQNGKYLITGLLLIAGVFFGYLKARLIGEVRKTLNQKKPD